MSADGNLMHFNLDGQSHETASAAREKTLSFVSSPSMTTEVKDHLAVLRVNCDSTPGDGYLAQSEYEQ